MAGRKPKPTHLKVLAGNPGRRPLPQNEPKPENKIPTCPSYLKGEAKREWNRVTKLLNTLGMISELDRSTLAAYCQTWGDLYELENFLNDIPVKDRVFRTTSGYFQQIPQVGMVNKLRAELRSYIGEFGFSPSARSRIEIEKPDTEIDPLQALLARRKVSASG